MQDKTLRPSGNNLLSSSCNAIGAGDGGWRWWGGCVVGGQDRARSEVGLVERCVCGHLRARTLMAGFLFVLLQGQSFCYRRK